MHKRQRNRNQAVIEMMEKRVLLSAATALAAADLANALAVTATATPDLVRKQGAKPDGSTSPSGLGLTVAQMRGGYGLGQVGSSTITFLNQSTGTYAQGDGTGQTIALIDDYNDPTIAADLTTFDTAENLPAPPSFQVLNQSGQTSPLPSNSATSGNNDWASEEALDVEWSHAMAPGASIVVIECSSNLLAGDATAASLPGVVAASNSWGSSEGSDSSNDGYLVTPSGHAGVTFLASTGDTGAEISYPAESVNVVAVGGTTLNLSGNTWSSETVWSSGGGGTSAQEPQPSFQKGTLPTATNREDPDVSLDANPSTGVPIVDSWSNGASAPWSGVWGGTSLSSPMMAGLVAVADQGRALEGLTAMTSLQTDTRLYQLSKANFHDITSGSNGHAAVVGYDEASGIGSPIASVLVPNLAGTATVTGRIFEDNNGTGVYGGTNTALTGGPVYLDLNADGSQDNSEPTASSNSQGIYTFTDQPSGGIIHYTSPALTGYYVYSSPTVTMTAGVTQTVNFIYRPLSSKLVVTQQPGATFAAGATLSPVAITVENANGLQVVQDTSTVTLTLSSGTFSTGSSTATVAAVNGVATFSNLKVNVVGSYTLTASDGALTTATTSSFTVTKTTPTVMWANPSAITYGTALSAAQLDATASVPGHVCLYPRGGGQC